MGFDPPDRRVDAPGKRTVQRLSCLPSALLILDGTETQFGKLSLGPKPQGVCLGTEPGHTAQSQMYSPTPQKKHNRAIVRTAGLFAGSDTPGASFLDRKKENMNLQLNHPADTFTAGDRTFTKFLSVFQSPSRPPPPSPIACPSLTRCRGALLTTSVRKGKDVLQSTPCFRLQRSRALWCARAGRGSQMFPLNLASPLQFPQRAAVPVCSPSPHTQS
ncbi:hypothetical protein SKAU_G00346170 [Synaphobranchus kaupii]|uniref:Uncharacterized protein n=1 Tax=Synaphobranchus kaupii TaxID=118154 RepID=A0A9Q1EJM2_SYNKA|nr:hypothetical protein SKAU_G00346170 [Synaphobranchus kaupii]